VIIGKAGVLIGSFGGAGEFIAHMIVVLQSYIV